jgi:nicotinamidase/pyrazinamidase
VTGVLLWDVDTQVDFVWAYGKLAVPDAHAPEVVSAMSWLVRGARMAGIPHIASVDDHELHDPEISDEPDFANTYPPHCLRGTPGAEKIDATKQEDPLPFSLTPIPPGLIPEMVEGKREFLILKKNFDVFTNPNADPLLDALDPDEIVLFGVATDVCDDAAIRGLLKRGRNVMFVEEASRGLDPERTAACTKVWREQGVRWASVDEALATFS